MQAQRVLDLAPQRVAFLLQFLLVAGNFVGKQHVLPDQVADHFEETAAFARLLAEADRKARPEDEAFIQRVAAAKARVSGEQATAGT